tara:strand:+ start:273 stop:470 length:198 start_codon:yes stop_codon:yes gene_type:complete
MKRILRGLTKLRRISLKFRRSLIKRIESWKSSRIKAEKNFSMLRKVRMKKMELQLQELSKQKVSS